MPRRHVSKDLKERIPHLRYSEHYSVKEIERLLGVKKSMIYQVLKYYTGHGVVVNPAPRLRRGRRRKLSGTDLRLIKSLLAQNPTLYADELQDELLSRRGVSISITTILNTLRQLHFTSKCLSVNALERNDHERAMYMNTYSSLVPDPAMVMFIDEAAKNKKNPSRNKGWSRKGKRAVQRRCFVRGQRFSILPVLTLNGIIAHDIIPGSVTSTRLVKFLREHLVCQSSISFLPLPSDGL